MTFDTFKQEALDAGFDEVVERQWDADVFLDTHTHPVSVSVLVVKGEMWLGMHGTTRHLTPGSTFEVGYKSLIQNVTDLKVRRTGLQEKSKQSCELTGSALIALF